MLAKYEHEKIVRSEGVPVKTFTAPKVHSDKANQGGTADHHIEYNDEEADNLE